nr:hypothetical protein [Tanacetum cinerariifolium]
MLNLGGNDDSTASSVNVQALESELCKPSSGTTKPANPNINAPGMYAVSPKYIVPHPKYRLKSWKILKNSLGIGVGGIGGWLAVVVVVMMDGDIVDVGEEFHEISSSESSDGTSGTLGLEPVPSSVLKPPC